MLQRINNITVSLSWVERRMGHPSEWLRFSLTTLALGALQGPIPALSLSLGTQRMMDQEVGEKATN